MAQERRARRHARKSSPDTLLVALTLFFVVFGVVMLSSASSVVAFQEYGSSYALVRRQLFFGVAPGLMLLYIFSKVDYHRYQKYATVFLAGAFLLLGIVLIPGVGVNVSGAQRWISVAGFFSFQPAEIVKLFFVLFLAAWFVKRNELAIDERKTFFSFLLLVGAVGALIMAQPDFGTALIIIVTAVVLYFLAGASWKRLAIIFVGGVAVALLLVQIAPYRMARITAFLNPDEDPQGIGYHVQQARLAVGSGGWLGLGLGHSRQKFAYLPEVHSDSIFAIIAEELGFVVTIVIVALYLLLVMRMIRIARRAPDQFGYFIALGVAVWIGFQAFINIATMTQLLPLTGLPLPFISYGGTAMVAVLAAIGIVTNISKT